MGKRYPVESWSRVTVANRPGKKSCDRCFKAFEKSERFVVVDRQVDWFRGNDEVEAFHFNCAPARYHKERKKQNSQYYYHKN